MRIRLVKKSRRLQQLSPEVPQSESLEGNKNEDLEEGSDSTEDRLVIDESKKNAQKDKLADLNRSSGSIRASTRATVRRSEEWQVSNVSSEGNKNEDLEEGSDTTEDELVTDETEEVDPIQEAKRIREEINEMKAKMDEEAKRSEEKSKKTLAEMKAKAAQRKEERKAKQEERRRQIEAEESDGTTSEAEENASNTSSTTNNLTSSASSPLHAVPSPPAPRFSDEDGHTESDIEFNFNYFSKGGLNKKKV